MAQPYLEYVDEHQQIQVLTIEDRICIGRMCSGIADQRRLLSKDPRISRDHAEISWIAGRLQIIDTSRNGTWVNNVRMAAGSSRSLSDGDTIRVGDFQFRVVYPRVEASIPQEQMATEMTMVSPVTEVVTTMVADLRGFSTYAQNHSSSEVYSIIKKIFTDFSSIIEEYNGTVKDFAGDAVFAFWEHQDKGNTHQAVLACKAVVRQMSAFSKVLDELAGRYPDIETLQMGWGVTTGSVLMSQFGSRTADVAMVGDCVNLASRLSGMAKKDIDAGILVCSRTAGLVEKSFTLKDLGLHAVRGRAGREHIYALEEMIPSASPAS